MLTKPQFFYDHTTKQALGFQNPFYLKKAQQLEPKLYDGNVIKNTYAIMIPDIEETLMLAEESQFYEFFRSYLKKLKHHLAGFDVVVKERTMATAITEVSWGFEHTKACFRDEIIPFVKALKDIFNTFDQYLVDELSKVQNVFHQMEQAVEQHSLESKTFEVKMNQVLNENERLLEQVINKYIMNIVVNSSVHNTSVNVHECEKYLKLETELLNKTDFIEKETYDKLFRSYTTLEKHCISLEVDTQLNQEIFQRDNSVSNKSAPNFDQYFELNELKAQSQDKDTVIRKLKERIKSLSGSMNEDKVKKDIEEIETINIELDHKPSDNTKKDKIQQTPSSTQKNKVEAHSRTVKSSLKNKKCVVEPKGTANVQHFKLNADSELICVKCNGCMLSNNHDLCVLNFINDVNARAKSKSVKKISKRKVWKPTGKVFTKIGYTWRPTGQTFTIVSTKPDDSTAGEAVTTASVEDSAAPTTIEEITLAQTLIQIKAAKPKVVTTAATTTTTTRPKARGVVVQEPSEFRVPQETQPSSSKDKGKGIMIEPEVPLKRKDQIALDEQIARDIQAKLDAELIEEQKLARKQEEEANIALIESWENTQAMMEADRLLAERLQSREREELTDEEKGKLFMELMEKRRKHFAALRAQEKRNRPPTKAQKRTQMSTYLKHIGGYTCKQLKGKSFDEIQKLFDKEIKRVNTFVAMGSEVQESNEKKVEGSEEKTKASRKKMLGRKRAGKEQQQESSKKQRIEEDKELYEVEEDDEAELKKYLVIKKDKYIAIDVIPLATKPPVIIDYKLLKEGIMAFWSQNSVNSLEHTLSSRPTKVECLKLETELLNKRDFIEKEIYDNLFKSFTTLEKHCISLEVDTQLNQEIFQRDNSMSNQRKKYLVITALKDELRKLKRKALVDNDVTKHTIDPEMLKIDVEPITPKLLNKRTTHSAYIKHTQEEAAVLRDLVDHVKANYPLDHSLESACRITTTAEVPLRKPTALGTDTPKPVVTLVYSRKPRN
ncbi:hypothetical protein Tco_0033291 [Tanacetum coccineum]